MLSVEDQLMPINELQRADVVRLQNIQKNFGGCVPETVSAATIESGESTPHLPTISDNAKARTMQHKELARKLTKNPTQEIPSDNDLFRGSQFAVYAPEDEGDTSGRQDPLLTQKKKPLTFKKLTDIMSQGYGGRSASHVSV